MALDKVLIEMVMSWEHCYQILVTVHPGMGAKILVALVYTLMFIPKIWSGIVSGGLIHTHIVKIAKYDSGGLNEEIIELNEGFLHHNGHRSKFDLNYVIIKINLEFLG